MRISYIILAIAILLFFSPGVKADNNIQTLGTFVSGQNINLVQAGDNGTAAFTFCNISSIIYPNSTIALTNISMNQNGQGGFIFVLNNSYTQNNGHWIVNGFCGIPTTSWVYDFYINPVGKLLDTPQAITYTIIFVLATMMFVLFMVGGFLIPYDNDRDEMTGYIIQVSNKKYLKIGSWAGAYLTLMIMFYFAYIMSYSFLNMDFIGTFFRFAFYIQLAATLPLFILLTFILIANKVRDSQIAEELQRGFKIQ